MKSTIALLESLANEKTYQEITDQLHLIANEALDAAARIKRKASESNMNSLPFAEWPEFKAQPEKDEGCEYCFCKAGLHVWGCPAKDIPQESGGGYGETIVPE